jgi:hypothetical protein
MDLHQPEKLLHSKRKSLDSRDSPQNGRKSLLAIHTIRDKYPESTGNSKNSASKESTTQ